MYNNQGGYGTPPADPYGSPSGYNPGYGAPPGPPPSGYGPPPGPPPAGFGAPPQFPGRVLYGPPSGPPPVPRDSYPGQQYHQQHQQPPHHGHHQQGGYPGQFAPPSGPPPFGQSPSYAPPPGPPPMPPTSQQNYGPQFQARTMRYSSLSFSTLSVMERRKHSIGINYFGQDSELRGCINDARNIQQFLCAKYGYRTEDIVMLTDDAQNPRQIPTRDNIIHAMQWLVQGASPNDSLFFHYSGHGGQTKDVDGDEADGNDEGMLIRSPSCDVDFKQNMFEIMVRPLPPGCRLTAIFDYSTEGKLKEPNLAAEAGQGLMTAITSYAKGDMGGMFKSAMGIVKTATGSGQKAEKYARATRTSPADVVLAARTRRRAQDASEAGRATGAMSFAFMTALEQQPQQSYQQLLNSLRGILRAKYSQKPQLSSSHPMDTNLMFIC
ncbi:metacaspase-1 [Mycena latifolia]|nr:metacaspase-1 [Mycena latifolia]